MTAQEIATPLSRAHHQALGPRGAGARKSEFRRPSRRLRRRPVNRVVQMLPRAASAALQSGRGRDHECLKPRSTRSSRHTPAAAATWISTRSGRRHRRGERLFRHGRPSVELPLTTTIMLRAIADIARHNGEDSRTLEARLACLQVFALGAQPHRGPHRSRLFRRPGADDAAHGQCRRLCGRARRRRFSAP